MVKKVKETIEIGQEWFYECSIKETIAALNSIAADFGDDAIIYTESMGYDGPDEYFVKYERDETPEERQNRLRIARENREEKDKFRAVREKAERKEFERLRQKYG